MVRKAYFSAATFLSVVTLAGFSNAADEGYLLRYQLQPGQELTYRVVHSAKTKVKINDTEEASQVHTTSVRSLAVEEVNDEGVTTFAHRIDSVVMTQQAGDQPEIRWDSSSDAEPPAQFRGVAGKIGQVIDTIQINERGQVLERTGKDASSLGMGEIALPLPENRIQVGEKWSLPREIRVKDEAGTLKVIKIRELYTLEKVQADVATISVRSEPLTPISDQNMQSQLVQQLSKGTIQFHLSGGYVMNRRLDWQDNVVGFQGPASNMEYNARLTEELTNQTLQSAKRASESSVR